MGTGENCPEPVPVLVSIISLNIERIGISASDLPLTIQEELGDESLLNIHSNGMSHLFNQ